jgi:hypothetical protein
MSKDEWRLLRYGVLAALLMSVALWPIFIYRVKLPTIVGELICGAIAGGVFLLSKYRAGRRKSDRPTEFCPLADERTGDTKDHLRR